MYRVQSGVIRKVYLLENGDEVQIEWYRGNEEEVEISSIKKPSNELYQKLFEQMGNSVLGKAIPVLVEDCVKFIPKDGVFYQEEVFKAVINGC
mmetsp:Transcript_16038/g.11568  ORF Transcript_16038/g.11568 Transcript_16038/m.11568 type:complete len:93 (-) Transcript_16038:88-366(-)